jgi:hypothetical protein
LKIMSEGGSSLKSPSIDANDAKDVAWEAASGLDGLIMSVSNSNLAASASNMSGSKDNLVSMTSEASQESVYSTPATQPPPPVQQPALGTLSVKLDASLGENVYGVAPLKSGFAATTKKVGSGIKKIGARKLDQSSTDLKMDSFEMVEKSTAKAMQIEEDMKLSLKLGDSSSNNSSGSSSRLSAIYQESESISRTAPATSNNISGGGARTASSASSSKGVSYSANAGESFHARDRFSSAKSISSDQFFGRDEEDAAAARARLSRYSGASAISSDMLYHDVSSQDAVSGDGYSRGVASSGGGSGGDVGLGKLKESVRDFFDSIGSRIG